MSDIQSLLKKAAEKIGGDSALLDAQVLMCHCLDKNRTWLYTWSDKTLSNDQQAQFQTLVDKRIKGLPIAYITGVREFWGLELSCNPSTLIPRPDTEILVEKVLELIELEQAEAVDLGTGTGAIALALASEKPNWNITALDYSQGAVELAESNRQSLQIENVTVKQGDWLTGFDPESLDMIVSNPPYIDEQDHHLNEGDVRFEPSSALSAPNHGLQDIETIVQQAQSVLKAGGYLLFEHGYDQKQACKTIIENSELEYLDCWKDYGGNDRVTGARKV
jgi:release factor glutamine methyltransferase